MFGQSFIVVLIFTAVKKREKKDPVDLKQILLGMFTLMLS